MFIYNIVGICWIITKMDGKLWYYLLENKNNLGKLTHYSTNLMEKISIVNWRISLITLKLCVKRDNLGIPKELWNIIGNFIECDIGLKNRKEYLIACGCSQNNKFRYERNTPKTCPNCGKDVNMKDILVCKNGIWTLVENLV